LDDAYALLCLQVEWGADEAIDLDPIDRLRPIGGTPAAGIGSAPSPISRPSPLSTPGVISRPFAEVSKGTPSERAFSLAAGAATLEDLRAAVADFDGCALRDTASNLVFAEGDPSSTTLLIGEPPGREEDRGGHPFAGAEGQLLDQMLESIGLNRSELMLTPLLPWRPPGGRPASAAEIAICLPFLHRLIGLLKPRPIVLFGGTAARAVMPQTQARRRNPRNWIEASIPGMSAALPVLVLPSLADMIKNPPTRRDAWAGLRLLRRTLDSQTTQM
jgi:uracil-DNA glycosylase family 4